MQTFEDGHDAVKAWREDGGAMLHQCVMPDSPETWWVGTAEEISEMVQDQDTVRGATVEALVAAGLSDAEIDDLMRDWTDPDPETETEPGPILTADHFLSDIAEALKEADAECAAASPRIDEIQGQLGIIKSALESLRELLTGGSAR